MSIKKIMLVKNSSVPIITLTCLRLLLKCHISVITGTEEILSNIIFLINICLFNICFNLDVSISTQRYNTTFVKSLGSQNVL
jgi:hypothetical protein